MAIQYFLQREYYGRCNQWSMYYLRDDLILY